jgi:hypothetical protein
MEILAAFDLTGSLCDAVELAGCSHHTVGRYVAAREQGRVRGGPPARRPRGIDPFLEKLVERSHGTVRADVARETITATGYAGSEGTTRRAVARLKANRAAGRRRCSGILPAIDVALRRIGGVPTCLLTDNEKTVTVEHVAGVPVRDPAAVAFARYYGLTIATCLPADPATKGGSKATVQISKRTWCPPRRTFCQPTPRLLTSIRPAERSVGDDPGVQEAADKLQAAGRRMSVVNHQNYLIGCGPPAVKLPFNRLRWLTSREVRCAFPNGELVSNLRSRRWTVASGLTRITIAAAPLAVASGPALSCCCSWLLDQSQHASAKEKTMTD